MFSKLLWRSDTPADCANRQLGSPTPTHNTHFKHRHTSLLYVTQITAAMRALVTIGALDEAGQELTPLGVHLATLPVDVRVGKMLIYAAMLGESLEGGWV